jgi:integrase
LKHLAKNHEDWQVNQAENALRIHDYYLSSDQKQQGGKEAVDVERKVSSSTQNQALNALIFLYRYVLEKDLGENELNAVRARRRLHLPVVLTPQETVQMFDRLAGINRLMVMLIYGCGLRLQECLSLRIKDVDLERNTVIVRSGKGDKDRRTC